MDYHWDDEKAVIILDDEMSEFELADCQSERKEVEYVIGIVNYQKVNQEYFNDNGTFVAFLEILFFFHFCSPQSV